MTGIQKNKKFLAFISALLAAFLLLPAAAFAVDFSQKCSLTVLPCGTEVSFKEDLKDLKVDLYYVARISAETNGRICFIPNQEYITLNEHLAGIADDSTTAEDYEKLAQNTAAIAISQPKPLMTIAVNEKAEDLESGLYLLIAHDDAEQFLYTDEKTGLITSTYNYDQYTYVFSPELVTLPSRDSKTHEWSYDALAVLKPKQETRFGKLEIVKTLEVYETESGTVKPAVFVFSIEAMLGGNLVYSDVVGINFTAPGQRSVVVEHIPVGSEVTVTEVYGGTVYKLVSDREQTATVSAEEMRQVLFKNTYNGGGKGGHGVVNSFHKDEDGWHWEPITDNVK